MDRNRAAKGTMGQGKMEDQKHLEQRTGKKKKGKLHPRTDHEGT
jgi:hypothetical protein